MRRVVLTAVAVATLVAGCGGNDESTEAAGDLAGGSASQGEDACALLTEDEIADVIGDHDGGMPDLLYGGCMWTAKAPNGEGFTEWIRAAVLPENRYDQLIDTTSPYRQPVDGLGDGATYSAHDGDLWFKCEDKWCGVQAYTAGDDEQITQHLGSSLNTGE